MNMSTSATQFHKTQLKVKIDSKMTNVLGLPVNRDAIAISSLYQSVSNRQAD